MLWRCHELPLGRVADVSSECSRLGFLSLLRKNPENFTAKVLYEFGRLPWGACGSVLGCMSWLCPLGEAKGAQGLQAGACSGEHKMAAPLAGPPACRRQMKPGAPTSWKIACYWQHAFLCRRDSFVSS